MDEHLTRRDFLKMAGTLSLACMTNGYFSGHANSAYQNPDAPNVIVLVFDALSARHMSLYGYPRETTPNIKRFAEKSTVYHLHHAGGNFTTPGTASLLTGTLPWTHRAIHLQDTVLHELADRNIFQLFADKNYHRVAYSHNLLVTSLFYQFQNSLDELKKTRDLCLADLEYSDQLFDADYTSAFISEWLSFRGTVTPPGSMFFSLLHRMLRMVNKRRVTSDYGALFPRGIPSLHNLFFIMEDAVDWIQEQVQTLPKPYLGYFHLLPPHEPYTTRADFVNNFKDEWTPIQKPIIRFSEGASQDRLNRERREYDEYLAYADSEFGRLLDTLENTGAMDNTIVVFTSDHGELFERGIRGHVTPVLYHPVINVPLIIHTPGQKDRKDVFEPTSCIDVMPTLLHLTGQPIPDWVEGKLLPPFDEGNLNEKRVAFSVEAKSNAKFSPLKKVTFSMVQDPYQLILYKGYGDRIEEEEVELYHLTDDPEQLVDLSQEIPDVVSTMKLAIEKNL